MRRLLYFVAVVAVVAMAACKGKNEASPIALLVDEDTVVVEEQGVIYGLACEGCTDSVVWLLPLDASNPIPYDIVNATRQHKILGRIRTGDDIIIVVNENDSTVADMVIDGRELKGTWCFTAMPTLRGADNMSRREQQALLDEIPDSIKEQYYRPIEYGFTLKRNNALSALSLSMQVDANAEDNPFVYAEAARYTAWHFVREHFVLSRTSVRYVIAEKDSLAEPTDEEVLPHFETTTVQDTTEIVYLSDDSLAIKFKDHTQGYYRKQ